MKRIEKDIKSLSKSGKILFAVLTAEKLLPYYSAFQRSCDWGDVELLREGIDTIYLYLVDGNSLSDSSVADLLDRLDNITPDVDDFSHRLTSFALDACTSVAATLDFMLTSDDQHIVEVASYARDTVDRFIHLKNDPDFLRALPEKEIDEDPYMVNEKIRQTKLIIALKEVNNQPITDTLIQNFRDPRALIDLSQIEVNPTRD